MCLPDFIRPPRPAQYTHEFFWAFSHLDFSLPMLTPSFQCRRRCRHLRERRIVAVIPEPADQQGHRKRRGARGGRPPAFDRADYRNRNVVERGFCHVKQWRGLATRYDKLALTFRGGAVLKAIVTWLRALGDTP